MSGKRLDKIRHVSTRRANSMSIEISGLDNTSFLIDRYYIMTTFLDKEKMYFELNI